jgi:hypothetical protein
VEEPGFIHTTVSTLAKMSCQAVLGTRTKVRKAKQSYDEERETIRPDVVAGFFASVLLSLGTQVTESTLCKNTREEVMWSPSTWMNLKMQEWLPF